MSLSIQISAALASFVLAMVNNPEVQRTAQNEIDAIVGPNRLPEFADAEFLPYVDALVKEVLRSRPVAPMSVPHAAKEDDIVEGYLIPKGSIVIGNTWYAYSSVLSAARADQMTGRSSTTRRSTPSQSSSSRSAGSTARASSRTRRLALVRAPAPAPRSRATSCGSRSRPCCRRSTSRRRSTRRAARSSPRSVTRRRCSRAYSLRYSHDRRAYGAIHRNPLPFECGITPRTQAASRLIDETASEGSLTA
jgi:hypothetical protein